MNLSPKELNKELANSITHGFGLILSIIAIPALITQVAIKSSSFVLLGVCIFGLSMLMVYTFSTLYHSFSHPKIKLVLKTLDHISIYFLIAGTYTPFIFLYEYDYLGKSLLITLWTITLFGVIFKIFFVKKFKILSTIAYVLMGGLILVFPSNILEIMPQSIFKWIAIGGVFYAVGVVFYLWKKWMYHHAIWHLFVLAGSASHFWAIWESINKL